MEKKNLAFRIVHAIIVITGIVLYAYLLIVQNNNSTLGVLVKGLELLTLVLGLIYIILGYKKNARLFYQMFMVLLVISQICDVAYNFSNNTLSLTGIFFSLISLVLFTLLASAKDYGLTKSFSVSILLLSVKVLNILSYLPAIQKAEGLVMTDVLFNIGQFVLACSASLMVLGKYIDKDSRGKE